MKIIKNQKHFKVKRFNDINESNSDILDDGRLVIQWIWMNSRDTIGAVAVKLEDSNEWTAYLGAGNGHNEEADVKKIADYGYRLSEAVAVAMFPHITEEVKDLKYKQ